MVRITSFLHRNELQALIRRWMLDQALSGDAADLLPLVHFNAVFVSRYIVELTQAILVAHHGCRVVTRKAPTKGVLKDQIVRDCALSNMRANALIAAYRREPGLYFRQTPFQGLLYFGDVDGQPTYLGCSRVKRLRRLAEKTARRLVDGIADQIQLAPEQPGRNTARPSSGDAAKVAMMRANDLFRAQAALLQRMRADQDRPPLADLMINDVAGIKIVIDSMAEQALEAVIAAQGCRLVERERHTGAYNALNLIVEYEPDKERLLAASLPDRVVDLCRAVGLSAADAERAFRDFVRSGEPDVRVEIILSSYPEMLESEIGRCMHEERIIRQREIQRYRGQLAQNLEFLLEYLFMLPSAPRPVVAGPPIRLWDRHLPDDFDEVRRRLFCMPSMDLY